LAFKNEIKIRNILKLLTFLYLNLYYLNVLFVLEII